MKPKFIENLETEAGIFSKMVSYDRGEKFVQNLLTKKYKIVYSVSSFDKGEKPRYLELIFETAQPFYVHLSKKDKDWSMDIYYLPEKYKELIFFINQIEKSLENATTDNTGTQTKN